MVFEKLFKFIGKNIKALVDRPDEPHCFRLQKNRVYYVRESLMKKATNVGATLQQQRPSLSHNTPQHACCH
jgi:60S ribosome subunit biogenesis protein NIP7